MGKYKDPKSGVSVSVADEKFRFPTTGKMLVKQRPPIAKEVSSD